MFNCLFKVFDQVDNLLIDDDRIIKAEFMKIRTHLHKVEDLTIINPEDITEEMWLKAYNDMNVDNNEFISFHEACEYTLKHLHEAFGYQETDVDEHEYDNKMDSTKGVILGADILFGPKEIPVEAEVAPVEAEPVPVETVPIETPVVETAP